HIFNDDMLRPILRDRGHSVGQHSCDLLLHLYEEEGVAGWQRADGQFALALWDARKKHFLLARDCLGLRPLYYWSGGGALVFASEIKALLRHRSVPRAVDETAVADFLTFTSVPGPRTLFRDVCKVPPASAIVVGANRSCRIETYWDLLQNPIPESSEEAFYIERVRALHASAVARRDVDESIGSLLSGGNDSSANAALLSN